MSVVEPNVTPRTSVEVSRPVAVPSGTGVSAPAAAVFGTDAVERRQLPRNPRQAQWVAPTPPVSAPASPAVARPLYSRTVLEAWKANPATEERYWRAVDEIAADIRSRRTDRVAYAREILDGLRDPESHDGRGEIAADVYQRIEPLAAGTPEADRAGRLTDEEKSRLLVPPAEVPPATPQSVGGPTWSRPLSSFDNTRIDVQLPSGASDYMSYKPYRFGTARTIETLKRIAERHRAQNGQMLRVGDIAREGGGRIPDHSSHRDGKIFDLDLVFNDGRTTAEPDRDSVNATWRSPAYDRDATRRLVRIIKAIRPEAQILFSDPVLVSEGLVRQFTNHDNHMHVQRLD